MNSVYGYKNIKGYRMDVFGFNEEKDRICYEIGGKCREAKRHYVCGFGGNPYPGTLIEYYNIILPNGKRARYSIYS